jgi:ATP-dependent helicase HrpA
MENDLAPLIDQAMMRDRWNFRRRWEALRARGGGPAVEGLRRQVEASIAARQRRLQERPAIRYPEELPVSGRRDEIRAAIEKHQVVVVCGETGSGKTTQLPKILLEMGRGVAGMIGHTQPRRIAARSVAARIAEELGTNIGEAVAYKIRFSDNVSEKTYIKLMTDGILLAETQNDRFLNGYDTLIIDEAHERSLNIDFLLGYLKQLLPKRPDLKIIITSATIDPGSFSKHFNDCPIVMVSGRTYPVEVRYRDPLPARIVDELEDGERVVEEVDEEEPDMLAAVVRGVEECAAEGAGDVLVFLSGEREIREAGKAIDDAMGGRVEIVPLYARLSTQEQQRVFATGKKRRIVLATNVAETSLTVPGIRYVVDSGLARISRYAPRSKVQRLPIEPVSQASANQRAGRCGRIAPGVCVRLYSESDFQTRPVFTEPEILRTNLAAVILQMKALRLGAVEDFPFLEKPNARLIADGYQTLLELGAVDKELKLTPLGEKLARLPIDPRIARMIIAGQAEGVEEEVLVIAAAMSVQDPRERPLEKQQAADAAHEEFRDEDSDFLSYLKLWAWWKGASKEMGAGKLRRACNDRFLSYVRMREWIDVHSQLEEVLGELRGEERAARAGNRSSNRPEKRSALRPPAPTGTRPAPMRDRKTAAAPHSGAVAPPRPPLQRGFVPPRAGDGPEGAQVIPPAGP